MREAPVQTTDVSGGATPFQALVFDLGGVLVAHDNARLYARLASRCADGCSPEAVIAVLRRTDWGAGAPIARLHEQLRSELGYGLDWEAFTDDWCCHFEVDHAMLDLVERLANTQRVMLFSNTNQQHWDFLVRETQGRLARLEAYLSHEIGCSKPSLRSFQIVAETAGIDPGQSVFFDDVGENVEGARRAGFQAELFESRDGLTAFLRSRGVRWD